MGEMPSGDIPKPREPIIAAADNATEPERKVSLLELAQRWLRLAFQVEKIGERNGFKGDALLDPPDADHPTR